MASSSCESDSSSARLVQRLSNTSHGTVADAAVIKAKSTDTDECESVSATHKRLRERQPRQPQPGARSDVRIEDLLLFIDDDIQQSAAAIARVEAYLLDTTAMLDAEEFVVGDERGIAKLQELAGNDGVMDEVEALSEALEGVRRRMARLSASLKP